MAEKFIGRKMGRAEIKISWNPFLIKFFCHKIFLPFIPVSGFGFQRPFSLLNTDY